MTTLLQLGEFRFIYLFIYSFVQRTKLKVLVIPWGSRVPLKDTFLLSFFFSGFPVLPRCREDRRAMRGGFPYKSLSTGLSSDP